MIELSFTKFMNGETSDYEDECFSLYIIKNQEGTVIYVGITRDCIYNRWFYSPCPHIQENYYGEKFGTSPIGRAIIDGIKIGIDFTICMYTKRDLMVLLYNYIRLIGYNPLHEHRLEVYEELLIKIYTPVYNSMLNPLYESCSKKHICRLGVVWVLFDGEQYELKHSCSYSRFDITYTNQIAKMKCGCATALKYILRHYLVVSNVKNKKALLDNIKVIRKHSIYTSHQAFNLFGEMQIEHI